MLTVSKLSQQQKAILECLYKSYTEPGFLPGGYWCHVSKLSWFVAHRFNKGHKDRVWDAKQAKLEILEDVKKELKELADAQGNFPDTEAQEKAHDLQSFAMTKFKLIDACHRRKQLLTRKHRASFSRSLRRLEERGLIACYVSLKTEERNGKWFWVWYVGDGRKCYVALTDKGKELCSEMLTISLKKEHDTSIGSRKNYGT